MLDLGTILGNVYEEVEPMDFYRDVFPVGSFEERGIYEDGKYNGIAVAIRKGDRKARRYVVTDDLEAIDVMCNGEDFCLMSPIGYAGKKRSAENAREMYALTIDLDGVDTLEQWHFFVKQIEFGHEMLSFVWGLPRPTYVIASGTGLHLYYVFDRPIPMYRSVIKPLETLKRRLTWQAWTQGASSLHDSVQYESLFQGFRVVGTVTKNGGRCRAFKVGSKVTLEYLNKYVPESYRAEKLAYKSDLSIADAKKKFPQWYEARIEKKRPRQTWVCNRAVYDWWIEQMKEGAEQGHRYWCIMTLATYAMKCAIPMEELEADAYGLIPLMNEKGDSFTEDDVLMALEAYKDSYITYPIDTIVSRTGIPIQKNKRNGRRQKTHLRIARMTLEIMSEERGEHLQGRPSKADIVKSWRLHNPTGKKIDCHRATGLSRMTIDKWWNED